MTWLQAVSGLIKLINLITGYMRDRQLLEAGEAKAISDSLSVAQSQIHSALAARRAVKHDSGSVRDDSRNRD